MDSAAQERNRSGSGCRPHLRSSSVAVELDPTTAVEIALALRAEAAESRHRRLLLLAGDAGQGRIAARSIQCALGDAHGEGRAQWIGNGDEPGALPLFKSATLLGRECELLIVDAHGGVDADALGAATGMLRGGGLLLLLTPDLRDWPGKVDPEAERIAVYPFSAADVGSRFIARLACLLSESPTVTRCPRGVESARGAITSDRRLRSWPIESPSVQPSAATPEQQQAVDAICRLAAGRARRPLVLSSDRGRGKSAALGIAAARLLADADRQIVVTAPRRAAAEAIFEHARALGAEAARRLLYRAPDALLRERIHSDLLLVDEAAGIPAPLLERMLTAHGRIVFATTLHGYEGSGRGFELRFRGVLDRITPGWRTLRLRRPIRWARHDPLECLFGQALLLDAEPAPDDQAAASIGPRGAEQGSQEMRFMPLDRDRLAADEPLLRQVFGLLVLGHYQTRPADLRHLLDGPNIEVGILRSGDIVLATALSAREGRLPDALLAPIFDGRRRPRGHLLPQTLSAQAGLFDAPRLGFTRVVRIAVHPAVRKRGLGIRLMRSLTDRARQQGMDLIGASFGATPGLLRFWRRCGLLPVQLGCRRNAASGAHAAVALRPLNALGTRLFETARGAMPSRLRVMLGGPLRQVEPALVVELLRGASFVQTPLRAEEQRELAAFAHASRGLEATLPALFQLVLLCLPQAIDSRALTPTQTTALIGYVLQQRDRTELADLIGISGKAELVRLLRSAVSTLVSDLAGGAGVDPNPPGTNGASNIQQPNRSDSG